MEPVTESRIFSGRYQLTHHVARGGMAQVYRAHDQLLDRVVALKILFPELSVDQTFVERFRREAQAAAKLSHPNIVPVFDWGEDEGTYFIVMEFIEGETLSSMIREAHVLVPVEAARIAGGVAEALDYAHRRGVVHRDIKPGNVLITPDGQVKVTDFGIARALNTEESLTQVGSVMGTATYFSPEQAEGTVVDTRSDIYSLGVVLYEMLTGRPPFLGDSPVAVASKHVREIAPLPRVYLSTLPVPMEAITMKAMAKNPMDRYQSAEEMHDDLVRFLNHEPVLAPDPEVAHRQEINATTTMAAINRTQAVPIFQGPRTDLVHKRKRRRGMSPWLIGLLAAAVLALVIGGAVWATSGHKGPLTVPNVVGMSTQSAEAQLKADDLVVGTITTQASIKPTGQVLSTNPAVGLAITRGSKVDLIVSDGTLAVQVTVPSVVGQQQSDAQNTLTKLGFQVSVQVSNQSPSSQSPSGTVLSQNPAANTKAAKGTTITLTIVGSPSLATVPTLIGQQAADASGILSAANLSLGNQSQACSNSYGKGIIASSSPGAGAQISNGSSVDIIVSSGPCSVTVPNVVDQSVSSANAALQAVGLIASTSCGQSDIVVSTNPGPGSAAQAGQTVTLTCAPPTTPPTVTPPTSPHGG